MLCFLAEARLSSKELPTAAWRRERRLRAGEYHHAHHSHTTSPSSSSTASSARAMSPPGSITTSPPLLNVQHQTAHSTQLSPTSTTAAGSIASPGNSNAHQISMMMAAAAAAGMRPLSEATNRPSPPPLPLSSSVATQALAHYGYAMDTTDDAPLDMSVASLKQRNSPPPPYREPLPGSQFATALPRPSVITQAPPKREVRENSLLANRENDNRSSGMLF